MKRLLLVITALLFIVSSSTTCAPSAPPVAETPTPAPTPTEEKELPSGAVSWNEAKHHIGERTTVYGPVVDTHWASGSKGKPTFLNMGKPYPDTERFTVVIWIQNRGNFPQAPEVYYLGKIIYVTGLITEYEGISQIEVRDPSQIEEQ